MVSRQTDNPWLNDKTVTHIFRMEGDRIVRFDTQDIL